MTKIIKSRVFISVLFLALLCVCLSVITVLPTTAASEGNGTVKFSECSARIGTTVTVDVSIVDNPGIAIASITLDYDKEALTLVSIENGEIFPTLDTGINLLWSADANCEGDGVLATLTFEVNENAKAKDYTISARVNEAYNRALEKIELSVSNGKIAAYEFIYGDVNDDDLINALDVLLLRIYMADYDYETDTSSVTLGKGADANGDGSVAAADVLLMRIYMANYDYITGKSSVVLGPQNIQPPVTTVISEPETPEFPALPEWPTDSVGLEVEYDGEFGYVLSIGDCTDKKVVIPATVNGFEVIEIDGFDGTEIEAIYLPNTSELTIARNAFADSTLTDVYYNGTAAEWEEKVSVKTGNSPITNATMHFIPYLVTFVDYDGEVLAYEYVEAGESATAPTPTREGYIFLNWDKSFDAVNSDLTVKARYIPDTTEPCIYIGDTVASAGDTVELEFCILNNPGIVVANLTVYYDGTRLDFNDDNIGAINGDIFPMLDSGLNLFFSADANCAEDGTLATVSFTLSEDAAAGIYPITVSINEILDENSQPVEFTLVAGSVIVK